MRLGLLLHFPLMSMLLAGLAYAQPSGGPYGPIDQHYEIPKAGTVYYVAPDGKTDAAGTDLDHPTTIESAIDRVVTGDAIVLRDNVVLSCCFVSLRLCCPRCRRKSAVFQDKPS